MVLFFFFLLSFFPFLLDRNWIVNSFCCNKVLQLVVSWQ